MSWTLDGKIRIHARLSNTSCMRVHYWTSVSLRRLYIGQFPSLHFKPGPRRKLRQQRTKGCITRSQIYSCTMELPNKSASFVVVFVLFCFHLGRICDLCFSKWKKENGKAFIHRTKIYCLVMTLYGVFNRLQAFLFFLLWGIKVGIERKHILHSWVADQSTAFLLAHGSHLNV